jgi:Domain of Unknown Function (DUF349)
VSAPDPEDAVTDTPQGPEPAPTVAENAWGRVDAAGTVHVRTPDGERVVGSWQADQPEEALAFYGRKYDDLVVQVDLLEQRLRAGSAAPDDAGPVLARLRAALAEPQVVGDLPGLAARLEAVEGQVRERREERRAARARALEEARVRKDGIATEAEAIAAGEDWRHGADRLRALLEEWKSLPRLERSVDDGLWRRFSSARTHYTRRRKAHFAELGERREQARGVKEGLVAEAEALATSTEWGATTRAYRDLMARWKAAGPAPKPVDDALWRRFRAAQDTFFGARNAVASERDAGERAALETKQVLLAEAEALLPVTDWKAAREALRSVHERWETAGRVPRDAVRELEARLRRVEEQVRSAEETEWQRTNPEARARAAETVDRLLASITDLEAKATAARERGDERGAARHDEAARVRHEWLAEARRALSDFGG